MWRKINASHDKNLCTAKGSFVVINHMRVCVCVCVEGQNYVSVCGLVDCDAINYSLLVLGSKRKKQKVQRLYWKLNKTFFLQC